jgi:hypothetical protein
MGLSCPLISRVFPGSITIIDCRNIQGSWHCGGDLLAGIVINEEPADMKEMTTALKSEVFHPIATLVVPGFSAISAGAVAVWQAIPGRSNMGGAAFWCGYHDGAFDRFDLRLGDRRCGSAFRRFLR